MNLLLRALGFIARAATAAVAVRLASRLIQGTLGGTPSSGAPPEAVKDPGRFLGRMVQDPQCGIYLPESRAVTGVDRAGRTHHFCSDGCRVKFLGERGGHP